MGYPEALPATAYCHMEGHYWYEGVCSRCGEQLRCGACGQFVTIEGLDRHLAERCPVRPVDGQELALEGES